MKLLRASSLVILFLIALTPALAQATQPAQVESKHTTRGQGGPGYDRIQRLGMAQPAVTGTPSVATRGGTQTVFVAPPPTGSDTGGDGSMGMPYETIQFAFLQAVSGDTIRVMPGTYNECISNTRGVLGVQKNLNVVADDWLVNSDRTTTIIDGALACAFPFSAVNIVGTGTGSRLEGFTVTNAVSSGVLAAGSAVVTNNFISDNSSREGGGIFGDPLTCTYGQATLEISNNQIVNNTADDVGMCTMTTVPCASDTTCGGAPGSCEFQGGNGGGIYIRARVREAGGMAGCIGGDATLTVSGNTIDSNGADNALGGGLFLLTDTDAAVSITAQVTTNVISNNSTLPMSIGYGGGAWIGTYGYGSEQIDFINNSVSTNVSTGDGGGVSAWLDGLNNADHTINLTGNDVQQNVAEGGGGGLDLFAFLKDVTGSANSAQLTASGNLVAGNEAQGIGFGLFPGAGGGIVANAWSQRSVIASPGFELNIRENEVRGNTASLAGGGIAAVSRADGDPDGDPAATDQAASVVRVINNLVATNLATDSVNNIAVGGGMIGFARSRGGANAAVPSLAEVVMQFNTVAANASDMGSGGIEIETETELDSNGINSEVGITLDHAIIFDNSGFAAGGPAIGNGGVLSLDGTGNPANTVLTNGRNSIFMNDMEYGGPFTVGGGDQFVDPLLDGGFRAMQCSPTIDAGRPGSPPGAEPAPHGNRYNLGHTGGLDVATQTLADTTGDGYVDGLDILALAKAFGTSPGHPRWNPNVDLDQNNAITGIDLALMSANFAESCL